MTLRYYLSFIHYYGGINEACNDLLLLETKKENSKSVRLGLGLATW